MNIKHAKINDKQSWNTFVQNSEMGSFLQSWEWGDFVEAQDKKIWRLILEEDNQIFAVAFF